MINLMVAGKRNNSNTKETAKIASEINEMKIKKVNIKNQKSLGIDWKIPKQTNQIQEKKKTQINQIRDEKEEVTTDYDKICKNIRNTLQTYVWKQLGNIDEMDKFLHK